MRVESICLILLNSVSNGLKLVVPMATQSSTRQSTASARFRVLPPGQMLQPSFVTGLPAPESGPNRQGSPAGWLR